MNIPKESLINLKEKLRMALKYLEEIMDLYEDEPEKIR